MVAPLLGAAAKLTSLTPPTTASALSAPTLDAAAELMSLTSPTTASALSAHAAAELMSLTSPTTASALSAPSPDAAAELMSLTSPTTASALPTPTLDVTIEPSPSQRGTHQPPVHLPIPPLSPFPTGDGWREALRPYIPPATLQPAVARFLQAWIRRRRRKARIMTARTAAGHILRSTHVSPLPPPSSASFDPTSRSTAAPQAVLDAVDAAARAAGMPPSQLAAAVASALAWSPRTAPAYPVAGAHPVASSLDPDVLESLQPFTDSPVHLRSIAEGGFDSLYYGPRAHYWAPNHRMSSEEEEAMAAQISKGVQNGWLVDVTAIYEAMPTLPIYVSPVTAVPKASGGFRKVDDESGPAGHGPNHYVHPQAHNPVQLHSATDFAADLWCLRAARPHDDIMLYVADVDSAYKRVPLRVQDYWQHATVWHGRVYWSVVGLFGSRTHGHALCAITNAIANLTSAERSPGSVRTFVDDAGIADYPDRISDTIAAYVRNCERAGLPLSAKTDGDGPPSTVRTFIGYEWDTGNMTVSVPQSKLDKLRTRLLAARDARSLPARQVASLLGIMRHVASVAPTLNAFCTRLTQCTSGMPAHHYLRLDAHARADIDVWLAYMDRFTGISLIPKPLALTKAIEVFTDASTSTGFGWWCPELHLYASEAWHHRDGTAQLHIDALELIAAYTALWAIGKTAEGKERRYTLIRSDNTSTCACIARLSTSSVNLAPMTRAIALSCALDGISPLSHHVQGVKNDVADPLSRGSIPEALQSPEMRRVRFRPDLLASLLTSPKPWQVTLL